MSSVKVLAESPNFSSIPSSYDFSNSEYDDQFPVSDPESDDLIPVIDFSLLASSSPEQHSKIIHDLGNACKNWGVFLVVNHGLPESLMKAMMDASERFFNLKEEKKREFAGKGKHVLDSMKCGTSVNASADKVLCWRDFFKFCVHPQFHSPTKPPELREISLEYSKRTREIARELIKGVSESLGLEASYIEKVMNLDSGLQLLAANFYPPCPQPELALGIPPHSDHGLLALLSQNGIGGLQLQHNGKWVNVNSFPLNSFLAIVGDQIEILSNGRYKSAVHRATVNSLSTRMSIVVLQGPSVDTVVTPAEELINSTEGHAPAYNAISYKEYLEMVYNRSALNNTGSSLDKVRI